MKVYRIVCKTIENELIGKSEWTEDKNYVDALIEFGEKRFNGVLNHFIEEKDLPAYNVEDNEFKPGSTLSNTKI